MKQMTLLALGAALALTLNACGDDGRRAVDSGTIVIMDSGMGTDTGTGTDGSTGTDTGGGGCPPQTLAPPAGGVCAMATLTCLMACTTAECQQGCLEADPAAAACNSCVQGEIIACATSMGCAQQAGDVECCAQENCATAADQATCIQSMCVTESNALIECTNGLVMSRTCGLTQLCFMAG